MNFAEQLKAESDLAVVKFADEFSETIKPKLEQSAKEGYGAYKFKVEQLKDSEKEKLHLYTSPVLVDRLNKNLDGVSVEYKKEFVENLLFKGRGWHEHYLIFRWR